MISNFGVGAGAIDSTSTPDCAMAGPDPARARANARAAANVLADIHLVSQIHHAQASETPGGSLLPPSAGSGSRQTIQKRLKNLAIMLSLAGCVIVDPVGAIGGLVASTTEMPASAAALTADSREGQELTQITGALERQHAPLQARDAIRGQRARRIVAELGDHLVGGDRPVGSATLALLTRLHHSAVLEPYLHPAGEGLGIARCRIDAEAYAISEREQPWIVDALIGKGADADTVAADRGRDAERQAELGIVGRPRPALRLRGLADNGHLSCRHEALDLCHLLGAKALVPLEPGDRVEVGMIEMAAGVELERAPQRLPFITKIFQMLCYIGRLAESGTVEAQPTLERCRRSREPVLGQGSRLYAGLRRPSGVDALDP